LNQFNASPGAPEQHKTISRKQSDWVWTHSSPVRFPSRMYIQPENPTQPLFQQDIMLPSATGYRHWANIFRRNSVLHIISSKWKIRYDCIRHISDPKTMNRYDFPLSNEKKSTVYRFSSLSSNFLLFLRGSVHQMRKINNPSANAPSIAKTHIFF